MTIFSFIDFSNMAILYMQSIMIIRGSDHCRILLNPGIRCNSIPSAQNPMANRPIAEACPSCGRAYVLEKVTKKEGTTRFCDSEGCSFKQAVNS